MKIALDATPLSVPSGGVRRYTEQLSLALAENFPADEFWLLSDQRFETPSRTRPNLKTGRRPGNVLERRWWLWGLQREIARLGISLFHGTDFSVPYLPACPSVMTVHDLSPWMDPTWHSQADRIRNRTPLLLRLGLATMVITPSEAVRKQVMERFRLPAARVVAVPLAAAPMFRPVPAPAPATPFLLFVGTLEPRKNLELLVEAWRQLRREHRVDLIIAGRRRQDAPEIAPEPGLKVVGMISDLELAQLFSSALAFVYPSYYEGFGLPVLEAMQCGAAVIASRDPAIGEVAGDAAILVDAGDRRAWVETLRGVLASPDRLCDLRQRARTRAAGFSWTQTAELTRDVYAQAAQRFRRKA
jgi:glycosyltransferase involved in cell wall biosynthesis